MHPHHASPPGVAAAPVAERSKAVLPPLVTRNPATWETLLAGAVAGIVAETMMHPFDTVSLRSKIHPRGEFGSFAGAFGLIYRQEGIRGYFAGVRATMLTAPVSNAVYFTVYERLKRFLNSRVGPGYEPAVFFLAGGLSEVASSLLVMPMEVTKARLQLGVNPNRATGGLLSSTSNFPGVGAALRGIYRERGPIGLTAGWRPALALDMTYSATQFLLYEQMKVWGRRELGRTLTTVETLIAGSIAGAVAAFVTNPIDVIAARMMVQGISGGYGGSSMVDVIRATAAETPLAFWRGALPRVAALSPMSAVNFCVYEAMRTFLVDAESSLEPTAALSSVGASGGAVSPASKEPQKPRGSPSSETHLNR